MMRRATAGSSFCSCLVTLSANSIRHAKLALQIRERDQAFAFCGHGLGNLPGKVKVLEIFHVLCKCLLDVERLAASGKACQPPSRASRSSFSRTEKGWGMGPSGPRMTRVSCHCTTFSATPAAG